MVLPRMLNPKSPENQSFIPRIHHRALVFLLPLLVCAFVVKQADAQIQTDAHLWSTETSSRVGAASQVGSSDLVAPAMLGIAMIGLAIYFYRFRKLG
jgi:LPXTG-motif cell wall-anchored protein